MIIISIIIISRRWLVLTVDDWCGRYDLPNENNMVSNESSNNAYIYW